MGVFHHGSNSTPGPGEAEGRPRKGRAAGGPVRASFQQDEAADEEHVCQPSNGGGFTSMLQNPLRSSLVDDIDHKHTVKRILGTTA